MSEFKALIVILSLSLWGGDAFFRSSVVNVPQVQLQSRSSLTANSLQLLMARKAAENAETIKKASKKASKAASSESAVAVAEPKASATSSLQVKAGRSAEDVLRPDLAARRDPKPLIKPFKFEYRQVKEPVVGDFYTFNRNDPVYTAPSFKENSFELYKPLKEVDSGSSSLTANAVAKYVQSPSKQHPESEDELLQHSSLPSFIQQYIDNPNITPDQERVLIKHILRYGESDSHADILTAAMDKLKTPIVTQEKIEYDRETLVLRQQVVEAQIRFEMYEKLNPSAINLNPLAVNLTETWHTLNDTLVNLQLEFEAHGESAPDPFPSRWSRSVYDVSEDIPEQEKLKDIEGPGVEKSPIPIDKYTSHLSSFSPTTTRAPLAHSYWAINHVSYLLGESGEEGLELRYDHWESHLAWSRRTHFARHIPQDMETSDLLSSQVLIASDMTIMTNDRLAPYAQLIQIQADSIHTARQYLEKDPLYVMGSYTGEWTVWEGARETGGLDDPQFVLDGDVIQPFVAMLYQEEDDESGGTSTPNNKNTKKKQSKTAAATTTEDKDEDLLFSQYLSNSRHNHLKLGYNKTHPLGRTSDQFSRIVQLHNLHNPDSRSSNPENLESGLSTNLESADSGSESGSSRLSSWGLSTDAATMSASEYYDNPGPHNGPVDPWEYEEMEKELVAAGKIDTEDKLSSYKNKFTPQSSSPTTAATTPSNQFTGQLLLLNAASRRDAIRYLLTADPLYGAYLFPQISDNTHDDYSGDNMDEGVITSQITSKNGRKWSLLVSPVSMIDPSGLHRYMPRTFRESQALAAFHYSEPSDVLYMKDEGLVGRDDGWNQRENDMVMSLLDSAGISVEYRHLFHDNKRHHEALVMEETPAEAYFNKLEPPDKDSASATGSGGSGSGSGMVAESSLSSSSSSEGKKGRGKAKKSSAAGDSSTSASGGINSSNSRAMTDFMLGIIRERAGRTTHTSSGSAADLTDDQLLESFAMASEEERSSLLKEVDSAMSTATQVFPPVSLSPTPTPANYNNNNNNNGNGKSNRESFLEERQREHDKDDEGLDMPEWWTPVFTANMPPDAHLGELLPLEDEYYRYRLEQQQQQQQEENKQQQSEDSEEDALGNSITSSGGSVADSTTSGGKKRKYTRKNSPDSTSTSTQREGESREDFTVRVALQSTPQRLINPRINHDRHLMSTYFNYLPREAVSTKRTARSIEEEMQMEPEAYNKGSVAKLKIEKDILKLKYNEKLHGDKMKRFATQQPSDYLTITTANPLPERLQADRYDGPALESFMANSKTMKPTVSSKATASTTSTKRAAGAVGGGGGGGGVGGGGGGGKSKVLDEDEDDDEMIDGYNEDDDEDDTATSTVIVGIDDEDDSFDDDSKPVSVSAAITKSSITGTKKPTSTTAAGKVKKTGTTKVKASSKDTGFIPLDTSKAGKSKKGKKSSSDDEDEDFSDFFDDDA